MYAAQTTSPPWQCPLAVATPVTSPPLWSLTPLRHRPRAMPIASHLHSAPSTVKIVVSLLAVTIPTTRTSRATRVCRETFPRSLAMGAGARVLVRQTRRLAQTQCLCNGFTVTAFTAPLDKRNSRGRRDWNCRVIAALKSLLFDGVLLHNGCTSVQLQRGDRDSRRLGEADNASLRGELSPPATQLMGAW